SHWVFFPVAIANLKKLGYDPFLWVAFAVWNFAELGMALAILAKGKKRSVKTFSATAAFSIAASGITEPAVYGLMLKMKKPIIPSVIASGIGGLFFGLFHVKVFSLVTVSILSLPQFINPAGGQNFILAIMGLLITTAVSFVLNWFWGVDESMFDEDEIEAAAEV
ncbi:PTS system beta-glucoside-specific transporter subunit IIABC, partial [Lacticaseibacillus rhamnosus]